MFSLVLRSLSPCCGYINYNSTTANLPRRVYEIIAAEIEMLRCPLKSGLLSWERWSAGKRVFTSPGEWVVTLMLLRFAFCGVVMQRFAIGTGMKNKNTCQEMLHFAFEIGLELTAITLVSCFSPLSFQLWRFSVAKWSLARRKVFCRAWYVSFFFAQSLLKVSRRFQRIYAVKA